jgi:RND family efflux transporter MFP subunit
MNQPATHKGLIAAVLAASAATSMAYAQSGAAPPVPVVVTEARAEKLGASLSATGTVVSRNDARISGEVGGTLAWIAEPGAAVKRGEAVARIDGERLALALRDNEAALRRLDAQLQLLSTQRARLQTLGNVVSQSQLDEALSRERMAEQDVEQARVARDRARLDLNRATVRAPFDGIVAERLQQSGEFVAGGTPLLRLVNDRDLEVVARAPLTTADAVDAGARAQLIDGDRRGTGKVRAVIPVGDERSRMVELRIALDDRTWRVGAPVRVEIAPTALRAVVTVPRDAVILRQGGSYVMRVKADNTAERVAVNIGPGRANHVQIDGRLQAGDRVVVRGGERLEPGQSVKVQRL